MKKWEQRTVIAFACFGALSIVYVGYLAWFDPVRFDLLFFVR